MLYKIIMLFSSNKQNFLSEMELQKNINELTTVYMPMNLDSSYYKMKVGAIKKVQFILKHTCRTDLQERDFDELLLCSLTLVYYFGMRIKLNRLTSSWYWCGRRQFLKAEAAFQKTMDMLLPECSDLTVKITLKFFTEVSLWSFESFVEQILEVLLYFDRGQTKLFNVMLTDIHYVLFTDVKSARHRMRVFYELLRSSNWVIDKQKLLPFVTRLLDFFAYSIAKDEKNERTSAYRFLRKGFEVCLRRIFERVENQHRLLIITTMLNWFSMVSMNSEEVLEFSTLLDHAAQFYQVHTYKESFGEGLIEHVLVNLVGSTNATYSLVGCRLMLKFLDRQKNAQYLIVPTLYYEFSQVRLKVGYYDLKDKMFMRYHREKMNDYLLKAAKNHCTNIVNLKTIFYILCCIVLEVPCGLTAAEAACIVMAIQDLALNGENIPAPCRYWLHAVVISVMSLICWVHKAPLLYTYVNHIISRRAKEAPQLNPPLMYFYKIGRHHVTWNKPTLFFEDWELRYALWKHFQETRTKTQEDRIRKKAPTLDLRN